VLQNLGQRQWLKSDNYRWTMTRVTPFPANAMPGQTTALPWQVHSLGLFLTFFGRICCIGKLTSPKLLNGCR